MLWQLADIFTRRGHFEEKAKELLSSLDSHQITWQTQKKIGRKSLTRSFHSYTTAQMFLWFLKSNPSSPLSLKKESRFLKIRYTQWKISLEKMAAKWSIETTLFRSSQEIKRVWYNVTMSKKSIGIALTVFFIVLIVFAAVAVNRANEKRLDKSMEKITSPYTEPINQWDATCDNCKG